MKLLMITRKVDKDDAQAGFTYGWVKKIGQKLDKLYVITWQKSNKGDLPENIEIISWWKAIKILAKVDGVFCHQNPEYTILIAPWAKLFRKKIVTWYSHKAINWKVRLINILANQILMPTEEGFGLSSKKKLVVGHGIDTDLFKPIFEEEKSDKFKIISVGRISPIKNYETLIEAANLLKEKLSLRIYIIGGPGVKEQEIYFDKLKKIVKEKELSEIIEFKGLIPNQELPKCYQESDLSINLCPTGSPDKAVLEAMACALPVLVCNRTFLPDLGPYVEQLLFKEKNPADLAQKIIKLTQTSQLEEIGLFLRKRVINHHNLDKLVEKILNVFKKID